MALQIKLVTEEFEWGPLSMEGGGFLGLAKVIRSPLPDTITQVQKRFNFRINHF